MATRWDDYYAAEPEEPMFPLMGRDKHAPTLVWLWAALHEMEGDDPVKVNDARECGTQMRSWALDRGHPTMSFAQVALGSVVSLLALALDAKLPADVMRELLAQMTFEKRHRDDP